MRKQLWTSWIAVVCAVSLACASGKAPAEAALKAAEDAVNAARAEAEKLVPESVQALSDDLAAARELFNKGDYEGALAAAQAIPQKANEVLARAAAKKEQAKAWSAASADATRAIGDLKVRLEQLANVKKLPKGLTSAKVSTATHSLAASARVLTEAQDAASAGKLTAAVERAAEANHEANSALASIATPAPAVAATK